MNKILCFGFGKYFQNQILPVLLEYSYEVWVVRRTLNPNCSQEKKARHQGVYFIEVKDISKIPSISKVYISTPNSLHYDLVQRQLLEGRHVLCEKPICLQGDEAQSILKLSYQQQKIVMEGYAYKYHPQICWTKEKLKEIGRLKHIYIRTYYRIKDMDNIRLNLKLGGGVYWDMFGYALDFLKEMDLDIESLDPLSLTLQSHNLKKIDEVFHGTFLLGRIIIHIHLDLFSYPSQGISIFGEEGSIELYQPFIFQKGQKVVAFCHKINAPEERYKALNHSVSVQGNLLKDFEKQIQDNYWEGNKNRLDKISQMEDFYILAKKNFFS